MKSIVVIFTLFILVSCKNSNPTEGNISSSSQVGHSSSSEIKKDSLITSSSSLIASSSSQFELSSSSTIPVYRYFKETVSLEKARNILGIDQDEIDMVARWITKWDSIANLGLDSINKNNSNGIFIDSTLLELYDINQLAWCEFVGDSFLWIEEEIYDSPITTKTTYLIGDDNDTLMTHVNKINRNVFSLNTSSPLKTTDLNHVICKNKHIEINLNPICNEPKYDLVLYWESGIVGQWNTDLESFYSNSFQYMITDYYQEPACIL